MDEMETSAELSFRKLLYVRDAARKRIYILVGADARRQEGKIRNSILPVVDFIFRLHNVIIPNT